MENRLDIIAVRVQHECAVIPWMIRPITRRAIVFTTSSDCCGMKPVHGVPVRCLESQVHPADIVVRLVHPQFIEREILWCVYGEFMAKYIQTRDIELPAGIKIGNP